MIPKLIEGFTRHLGAPIDISSDDCAALGIRDHEDSLSGNAMWSAWEPTPEELAALNQGGSVYLKICGASHPMVWVCAAMAFDPEGDTQRQSEIREQLAKDQPATSPGRLRKALLDQVELMKANNGCSPNPEMLYEALDGVAECLIEQALMIQQLQGRQVLV